MSTFLLLVWLAAAGDAPNPYVKPAPSGFKPFSGRKVELRFHVAQKKVKKGSEELRGRLEFQNVGSEPVFYHEDPSIFKHCRFSHDFELVALDSKGAKAPTVILPGSGPEPVTFPKGMSEEEKGAFFERIEGLRPDRLTHRLMPGETLISRPRRRLSPQEEVNVLAKGDDPFAPLSTRDCDFHHHLVLSTGTYTLKAVYHDEPGHPTSPDIMAEMVKEGYSQEDLLKDDERRRAMALGTVESNPVTIQVVP